MDDSFNYNFLSGGSSDSFSLSSFLDSITTTAQQSAAAINSVRGSIASVQTPLVTTATRVDTPVPAKASIPGYVWAIGAVILYMAVK